jgi:hypothetical protein
MTMFNGIIPTGPLVVPAGVILRPLTRMLEADGALELEPHPTIKTAPKATSVIIVIVT